MAPDWGLLPLVLLATAATVIASQAVISGAFSLTQQAVQLGLLPRLEIRHTSESQVGQVYMPRVNWALLAGVLILVLGFRSSSALATAYGIAVTGDDGRHLAARLHGLPPRLGLAAPGGRWRCWCRCSRSSSIFLGANLAKLLDGGYVPLIIAAIVGMLMRTWVRGTRIVNAKAHARRACRSSRCSGC